MTKTATPQPIWASSQSIWALFTPSSILNLMSDAPIQINEDDVTVNKDPLPFSQYTVSYTVYLNEKMMDEDSKVYQLNKEIKSFVWRELNISVNLEWRLKKALHPYQKKRRQAEVMKDMGMKTYGYMNEMKALQALKAMKHVN